MKKTSTQLFIGIFCFLAGLGPAFSQYGVLWTDNFEGANLWSEDHGSNPYVYNRWEISSCNVINGSKSATVQGSSPGGCYYFPNLSTKSTMYRKFDARCSNHLTLRFSWKSGTQKSYARGSVIYSFDGVNWSRVSYGGPDNDGYYYGNNTVQTAQIYLTGVTQNFNYSEFYLGFEFETFSTQSGGYNPFTVDDLVIEGINTHPSVNAGPDVSGCPGETLYLQGYGQPRSGDVYRSNTTEYAFPAFNPGSVTVLEISHPTLNTNVSASQVSNVRIVVSCQNTPDLDVILIAPNGSSVHLSQNNGTTGGGGYNNTTFSSSASNSVTQTSNYTNAYVRPQEPFSQLTGPAKGIWKLKVVNSGVLSGKISEWSIGFANSLSYSWTPVQGLSSPNSNATAVNTAENTTYTLTARDNRGCTASDDAYVKVFYFPEIVGPAHEVHVNKGENAVINIMADYSSYMYTYSWEVMGRNSAEWVTLSDNSVYSGTNTPYLGISNASPSMDGNKYRVLVGRCLSLYAYSGPSTLHVHNGNGLRKGETGVAGTSAREMTVYPNPANGSLFIEYFSPAETGTVVSVYNVIGEKVQELSVDLSQGLNKISLDVTGLAPGIYSVRTGDLVARIVKN
jgi:hypothetical protein